MGKLHYLTALLLILLLAIASGWIFESIEKNPVLTNKKPRHDPDYFLQHFTSTTMNKTGKPAYQIKAERLEHYPDDNSMSLQKPRFSFYKNNIKSWIAQANEALILHKDDKTHLKGDIILQQILTTGKNSKKNNAPIKLTAKQLTIEPKRKLAYTKLKIKLHKGNSTIQAVGMRADISKNKIEFLSRTRSHIILPGASKQQPIDIKAQYILFDENKGISLYKGKVLFTKGTLTIKADAITLYYKDEELTKALITGSPADVKHRPDNEAKVHSQANSMEYFITEEQLILKGQAFVDQGNRHFSGEYIEYDTRQRSITAAGNGKGTENSKNVPPKSRVHVIIGPDADNSEKGKKQ